MKVDKVTATIKYSRDTGKGAWKAVEIGAEATVDQRERWDTALASLYADLGSQLKVLWANGHKAQDASTKPVEAAAEPEPTADASPDTGALLPGAPDAV